MIGPTQSLLGKRLTAGNSRYHEGKQGERAPELSGHNSRFSNAYVSKRAYEDEWGKCCKAANGLLRPLLQT